MEKYHPVVHVFLQRHVAHDAHGAEAVHEVTLYPVTEEQEPVGKPFTFSLRTSQVGQLIWYIMIAGAALLAVMIGRRIVLRIRNHRWRDA